MILMPLIGCVRISFHLSRPISAAPLPSISNYSYFVEQDSSSVNFNVLSSSINTSGLTLSFDTTGTSGAVTWSGKTINYQPASGFTGVDSFRYVLSNGVAQTSATIDVKVMAPYTWTGDAGDGLWNTAGNWCGTVNVSLTGCNGASSAPGASDTAIFDGTCTGSCNATLSRNINVGEIELNSGFAGTVSQQTYAITTGSWIQAAGTFTGSGTGAAMTLNGSFSLAGGNFTSTSGTFEVVGNWTVSGSPAFSANGGTVEFITTCWVNPSITPGSIMFNNVSLGESSCTCGTFTISGIMNVGGTLALNDGGNADYLVGSGFIRLTGNLVATNFGPNHGGPSIQFNGSGTQNITASSAAMMPPLVFPAGYSGTANFSGTIVVGSFTNNSTSTQIGFGSSTVIFYAYCNNPSVTPGSVTFNNVEFTDGSCIDQAFAISGIINVGGSLTFNDGGNGDYLSGGAISLAGNLTYTNFSGGSTALSFIGTSPQNISIASGQAFLSGAITVNSSGGLILASNVSWNDTGQTTTVQNGNIDMAGYNLTLNALAMNAGTIQLQGTGASPGTLTINGSTQGTGTYQSGTITN